MNKDKNTVAQMMRIASLYRGDVINNIIPLETAIERILSYHLSSEPEKVAEIFALLAINDSLSLSTKRNLLSVTLTVHYSEFLTHFPKFLDTLNKIITVRNLLAHKKMKLDAAAIKEFDGETIYFASLRTNRSKPEIRYDFINKAKFTEIKKDFQFVYLVLQKILYKISKGKEGAA